MLLAVGSESVNGPQQKIVMWVSKSSQRDTWHRVALRFYFLSIMPSLKQGPNELKHSALCQNWLRRLGASIGSWASAPKYLYEKAWEKPQESVVLNRYFRCVSLHNMQRSKNKIPFNCGETGSTGGCLPSPCLLTSSSSSVGELGVVVGGADCWGRRSSLQGHGLYSPSCLPGGLPGQPLEWVGVG